MASTMDATMAIDPETHQQTNPQTNSLSSSASDPKSPTLPSPSNDESGYPSFSKLLQGVVMAANHSVSSHPLVQTVGFQGQFGMSHQEALASVTAKAAQAHPEVQFQPDSTKPLHQPLPEKKVNKHGREIRNSSCHNDEPADHVPRTPNSDGYSWRKYGQKQVKTSGSSRSYYRCTYRSCCAKKKVQHLDKSGQIIDVVYRGDHNHDPPQNFKGSSRKKGETCETPLTLNDSSHSLVQKLDDIKCAGNNLNSAASTSPRDVEEQHTKTLDTTPRIDSEATVVPEKAENGEHKCSSSNELAMTDPDVASLKKKRMKKESDKAYSDSVYRTFKEPKIVVHAAGDVGISNDGYRWRKYGQKMVKGNQHPRSYYRCSSSGCPVRKHVERATDNSTAIIVTYEGKHNHDMPVPKKAKHHHQHASRNYPSVLETPTAANVLSHKSETSKSPSQGSPEKQPRDSDGELGEDKASEAGADRVLESARTLLSIGIELKTS